MNQKLPKRMTADEVLAYLASKGGKVTPEFEAQLAARHAAMKIQLEVLNTMKQARLDHNLSQQKLSVLSGVPQPEISRFESGDANPTLVTLAKLIDALGYNLTLTHK